MATVAPVCIDYLHATAFGEQPSMGFGIAGSAGCLPFFMGDLDSRSAVCLTDMALCWRAFVIVVTLDGVGWYATHSATRIMVNRHAGDLWAEIEFGFISNLH
jgi:hypothetical protein